MHQTPQKIMPISAVVHVIHVAIYHNSSFFICAVVLNKSEIFAILIQSKIFV